MPSDSSLPGVLLLGAEGPEVFTFAPSSSSESGVPGLRRVPPLSHAPRCRYLTLQPASRSLAPNHLHRTTRILTRTRTRTACSDFTMSKPAVPRPMTAAELEQHEEFPYVFWDLKPEKKGKLAAAVGRGGPVNIAYEVHGHGPIHLVWVMGLGGLKGAWQRQTKDFSHKQADKYTSVIIDNRGVGESDKPMMRYSTSEMAKDVIEVVDHLEWTSKRQLHVIGISMGGMIAQEMGLLIPDRIATLSLVSTASHIFNTVGYFENLRNRINLFIPRSLDAQLANVKRNIYTEAYLNAPDSTECTKSPFPTNGDRFAASEVAKRKDPAAFNRTGFMAQAVAAGWHHKSPEQLKEIADKVGRDRIMVIHGSEDKMITYPHVFVTLEGLEGKNAEFGEVEKHLIEGQGHVLPIEMREEFNSWVEALVARGEALNKQQSC